VRWQNSLNGRQPRSVATAAGSSWADSRPGFGASSGRGHNARWSSRAIRRADRTASAGLTPTTTAIIETAQSGRLSIARCPPSYWQRHLSHDLVTGSLTAAGRLMIAEIGDGVSVSLKRRPPPPNLHPGAVWPSGKPHALSQGPFRRAATRRAHVVTGELCYR
jgi:hypothetical protein